MRQILIWNNITVNNIFKIYGSLYFYIQDTRIEKKHEGNINMVQYYS
jgi:hypothetical protein